MNSEYIEIREVARLEREGSPADQRAAALLAKHFEKLLKREESQRAQLRALYKDLERLQPGPSRTEIAQAILKQVQTHNAGALKDAQRIMTAAGAVDPPGR